LTNISPAYASTASIDSQPLVANTEEVSLPAKLATLTAILLPFAGVVAAPFLAWGWGFGWVDLGLLLGFYIVSALGITVGYHRLFVHRSFETYMWVKFIFAIFGSMAVQGSLLNWAAQHRRHHQHSDTPHDPHSPRHHGSGVLGTLKGFWHAHIGWFFKPDPAGMKKYVRDLAASKTLKVASNLFPLWILVGLVLPAALGGLLTQSWMGCLTGLVWGGLVRVFLVHHVTWSVNSACHMWGRRPFKSRDDSRNNAIFGILAMGEGWHNTHHAFPTSVRHGLRWWEIDISYYTIRLMNMVGLAWGLKLPSQQMLLKERRTND
jgi:stearoyl-CoA desaturase (delta-9 desaturase)